MSPRRMLPKSLVALVIDADAHLIDGEADQPVEFEGHVWGAIRAAADREDRREPESVQLDRALSYPGSLEQWTVAERTELAALREFKAKSYSLERQESLAEFAKRDLQSEREELKQLREFKTDVVTAMGGQPWAGDSYLIEAIATDRARSEQLGDQRIAALDDAAIADAELVELRAFRVGVCSALDVHNDDERALTVLRQMDQTAHDRAVELEQLREFKRLNDRGFAAYEAEQVELREFRDFAIRVASQGRHALTLDQLATVILDDQRECERLASLRAGVLEAIELPDTGQVESQIVGTIGIVVKFWKERNGGRMPWAQEEKPKRKRSRSKKPCDHCGEADGHTEEECFLKPQGGEVKFDAVPPPKKSPPAGQLDLEHEAAAAVNPEIKGHVTVYRDRRPKRPTVKFPRNAGPTERCTQCGAELGEHNGTKCPPVTPAVWSARPNPDGSPREVTS